jgi:hypothetical protein
MSGLRAGRAVRPLTFERRNNGQALTVSGEIALQLVRPVNLAHVRRLCDDVAILEHAEGAIGRREHGYCTDDVARQLLVAALCAQDAKCEAEAEALAIQALSFLRHAALPTGRLRSRMNYARVWIDEGASDDAIGRALWGLGVAASAAPWSYVRDGATRLFRATSDFRSDHWHSMAYAILGASALLEAAPNDIHALNVLTLGASVLERYRGRRVDVVEWPWPERRVRYSAGALPDALIALAPVGASFADDGLSLLGWLAHHSVKDGHLSLFPAQGYQAGDVLPAYDQQPIEAQALASASWRAFRFTGDAQWLELLVLCAAWFVGHNDSQVALLDVQTGGCCDGLQLSSRNENQGAESTLAMLHTFALLNEAVAGGAIRIIDTIQLDKSAVQSDESVVQSDESVVQSDESVVQSERSYAR